MRIALFAAACNPAIDPPLVRKSAVYVAALIAAGRAFALDLAGQPQALQGSTDTATIMLALTIARSAQLAGPRRELDWNENVCSRVAVVPFSRVPNKLLAPEKHHYPIPAVADHRLRYDLRCAASARATRAWEDKRQIDPWISA